MKWLLVIIFAPLIVYSSIKLLSSDGEKGEATPIEAPDAKETMSSNREYGRSKYNRSDIPTTNSDIHSTPKTPSTPARTNEKQLMEELRRVQESDPSRALALAREGNRLYPNSKYAAERAGRIVKSLALQGKFAEARGEAEKMVNTYPGTPWALEVERHTGAHPHRRSP